MFSIIQPLMSSPAFFPGCMHVWLDRGKKEVVWLFIGMP
jgi:hypothetical protein